MINVRDFLTDKLKRSATKRDDPWLIVISNEYGTEKCNQHRVQSDTIKTSRPNCITFVDGPVFMELNVQALFIVNKCQCLLHYFVKIMFMFELSGSLNKGGLKT